MGVRNGTGMLARMDTAWPLVSIDSGAHDLKDAGNPLPQRVRGSASEGSIELDMRRLKNGDVAAFGIFQGMVILHGTAKR
jgi:hypothetical protein